jgi:hypothetical protein
MGDRSYFMILQEEKEEDRTKVRFNRMVMVNEVLKK